MKLGKSVKTNSRKKSPVVSAPKPATLEMPKSASTDAPRAAAKPITILAKVDVGFGNALYIRGEGGELSWTQGAPLTCVDGNTWKWTGNANGTVKFKLLVNDCAWAQGGDMEAVPGQKTEVTPVFP